MRGIAVLMKAAGCHVPKKAWHSLRHTFASHFVMAGGNILTLQKLLGHADLTMTLIYSHLAPDFMASEVAKMSFAVSHAGVADLAEERRKRVAEQGSVGQPVDTSDDTKTATVGNVASFVLPDPTCRTSRASCGGPRG